MEWFERKQEQPEGEPIRGNRNSEKEENQKEERETMRWKETMRGNRNSEKEEKQKEERETMRGK